MAATARTPTLWYDDTMAIVKFGVIVTAARGTIGGTIFSANKAGPYCKPWAAPARNLTVRRARSQATFAGFTHAWAALSPAQRDDWDDYGANPSNEQTNSLGEGYFLSGWQWFCKINGYRIQTYDPAGNGWPVIDPAIIEDAPTIGPPAPFALTALEAHYSDPQQIVLTFAPAIPFAGAYMLIEVRQLFSPNAVYLPPSFVALRAIEYGEASPVTFEDEIPIALGALRPGAQLALRAYHLGTDGARGTATERTCSVEA